MAIAETYAVAAQTHSFPSKRDKGRLLKNRRFRPKILQTSDGPETWQKPASSMAIEGVIPIDTSDEGGMICGGTPMLSLGIVLLLCRRRSSA